MNEVIDPKIVVVRAISNDVDEELFLVQILNQMAAKVGENIEFIRLGVYLKHRNDFHLDKSQYPLDIHACELESVYGCVYAPILSEAPGWFRQLRQQGYTGKLIMVRRDLEADTVDYSDYANTVINQDPEDDTHASILEALIE